MLAGFLLALLLCASAASHSVASAGSPRSLTTPEPTASVPAGEGGPVEGGEEPGGGGPRGPESGSPTPTPTPGSAFTPDGWEQDALRDLAAGLAWPTAVRTEQSGRMSVQRTGGGDWAMAMVRPFDYAAGATAAFEAEQEDARLSGFVVTTESFYTYRAYWAVLTGDDGEELDRRFHWVTGRWLMGVDTHGNGPIAESVDPREAGALLLMAAVEHGLPAPPGLSTPTPAATQRAPTSTPQRPPSAQRSPTSGPCEGEFRDVPPEHWAWTYIASLACRGAVSGYSDGSFRPQHPTTRGQLVKMVVLSEGWQLLNPQRATFRDVGPAHPFFRYVETAHARGIIAGYADDTFNPDGLVTRAQVAKIIVRARGWPQQVARPVTLCDVGTRHWAWAYVQVAIARGIFSGYADGCFVPDGPATRAQLAKVLVLGRP